MQTFLPYAGFAAAAATLDRLRLGKQRVECMQLLNAIVVPGAGWSNHPAARMWRGHERSLLEYAYAVCDEWTSRGYRDTVHGKLGLFAAANWTSLGSSAPPWLGDPAFHASHRSNLLRKDPVHYGTYGWTEPHDLPYVWPLGRL